MITRVMTWTLLLLAALTATASARIRFTQPTPSFEAALTAARRSGKPLIIDFSASWCGPCNQLAAAMKEPRLKVPLGEVEWLTIDIEDPTGAALKDKLAPDSGLPTILVFDPTGQEIARQVGVNIDGLAAWLQSLPELMRPTDEVVKVADADPRNGALQLRLAYRLAAAYQLTTASLYAKRAEEAGPAEVASQAAWLRLKIEYTEHTRTLRAEQSKLGKRLASEVATKYPGTPAGHDALRYLATLPSPPTAMLENLIPEQARALKEDKLESSLFYLALRGGASTAAQLVAERLAGRVPSSAYYLKMLAELACMQGQKDRAIAFAEDAIPLASANEKAELLPLLEGLKSGMKELPAWSQKIDPPKLEIAALTPPCTVSADRKKPSPKKQLVDQWRWKIRNSCWQVAGEADEVSIYVETTSEPGHNRVFAATDLAKPLLACIEQSVRAPTAPLGIRLLVETSLIPEAVEQRIAALQALAEQNCLTVAGKTRKLSMRIWSKANRAPVLHFSAGLPELHGCVEKTFMPFLPPRSVRKSLVLEFDEPETTSRLDEKKAGTTTSPTPPSVFPSLALHGATKP